MKLTFFLLIFGFSSTTAQNYATPHQFPFVVGINSERIRCVGSLISRRAILTLAECLQTQNIEAIFGAHDVSAYNEATQIRLAIGKEFFRFENENPLAIVVLQPQFAFLSNIINVADMPFSMSSERFVNWPANALGFLRNNPVPNIVRFWNVITTNNDDCGRQHNPAPDNMICLNNNDGCTTVAGSPLIIQNGNRFTQIGIQPVHNDPCGNHPQNDRARFIRITSYLTFIRRHM